MTPQIKKILVLYAILDGIFIVFSIFKGGGWLVNGQAAFLSSVMVLLSSFFAYQKHIQAKAQEFDGVEIEEEDDLAKYDDKFDLLSDEEKNQEFQKVVKEERAKVSGVKESFSNLKTNFTAFVSVYKLLAYIFMTLSFLFLQAQGALEVAPFLIGLSIAPIATILHGFKQNRTK